MEITRLRASIGLLTTDIAALFLSFIVATYVYPFELASRSLDFALNQALMISPIFFITALLTNSYLFSIVARLTASIGKFINCIIIAVAIFFFVTFVTKSTAEISRIVFLSATLLFLLSGSVIRIFLTKLLKGEAGSSLENVLIVSAGGPSLHVPGAIVFDAATEGFQPDMDDPHALHRIGTYLKNMDRIIVSCADRDRPIWAPVLRAAGKEGEFVSEALRNLGAFEIRHNEEFTSIVVSKRPLSLNQRIQKRVFDIIVSLGLLLLLSPLLLLVSFLIKFEDSGPVLFFQRRVGQHNKFFKIMKFRSMRVESSDEDANKLTRRNDDRVTRIGRFIRKTSIDELPQLLNVLRGEMSLVGPRPHAIGARAGTRLYWHVDERYWYRHALKPGLTGLAQIRGFRGATETEEDLSNRLRSDLEYLTDWNILKDLKIVILTVGVLIHSQAF